VVSQHLLERVFYQQLALKAASQWRNCNQLQNKKLLVEIGGTARLLRVAGSFEVAFSESPI
jgi:hypothetical protein